MKQDAAAVNFYARFAITLFTIVFCAYQLITIEHCEGQALYTGILSACVGIWLPTPTFKRTKQ